MTLYSSSAFDELHISFYFSEITGPKNQHGKIIAWVEFNTIVNVRFFRKFTMATRRNYAFRLAEVQIYSLQKPFVWMKLLHYMIVP